MALPKKKKSQQGYCAPCCSFICISVGIMLICIGTLIPAAINVRIQNAIYKGGVETPPTKNYTHYQKSSKGGGAGVFLIYHFYNVTNPKQVMNGEAPKLVKLGPYVFQKWVTEGQVQYFNDNKWRASRKYGEIKFIESRSDGKLTDFVYIDNLFANWFWKECSGVIPSDTTAKGPLNQNLGKICSMIATQGIFHGATIGEIFWGKIGGLAFRGNFKTGEGKLTLPWRFNNGHTVCPSHLPSCKDAKILQQYDPHSGTCPKPGKCGGQWSPNWAAKKLKEVVKQTGMGNEGCRRPLKNQGCFTQENCQDPWDPEDEGHNVICTKNQQVGMTGENIDKTNKAKFSFKPKGHAPPLTGFDYSKFTAAQIKEWWTNVHSWYDDTPYDTTDDLEVETTLAQDGGKPCKWDGSTDGKKINGKQCPYFLTVGGFSPFGQGLFYPPRQRKADLKVFDNGFFTRPMTLKYLGHVDMHAAHCHIYKPTDDFYKPIKGNHRYGMDSSANFWEFAGAGTFPMRKQVSGIPLSWSLPHWHRGGDVSDKWNTAMGLRKSNEKKDDFVLYFEPVTGVPFDANIAVQWNLMWHEKAGGCSMTNASNPSQVLWDFSNLDLSHVNPSWTNIDLTKLGKWMKDVTPNTCSGSTGCHSMHPAFAMKLSIELTPHTAAKLRNLVFGLKKLAGLSSQLNQLMVFGVCCIIATFMALAWKYFGPEADKSSALQAAA